MTRSPRNRRPPSANDSEPERTCVGCRGAGGKADLLRVVRSAAGGVDLDVGATAAGRGAYVHPVEGCIEAATRKGVLAKALRTRIDQDELGRLRIMMSQGVL
ncbi:MAG: YlxR family protein [Actinomycetota bacterium]